MVKPIVIVMACLRLGPWVQAATPSDPEGRAEQVNMDLKKDVLDQPGDSKKVTRLRETLRTSYEDYTVAVRKYGNGTAQSRKAAKKVMTAQTNLHKEIDYEEAQLAPVPAARSEPPASQVAAPGVMESQTEERKVNAPSIASEDSENFDDMMYNDIVKQYGKDSPQAEAARRRFNIR